jgi:DNA invertase Pin-like site-specific DNA recombinase
MTLKSDGKCSKQSKNGVSSDTQPPNRVFGYIRVSTAKQETENQKFEILKWADERKMPITEWVEETISSRKGYKERLLGSLLGRLQTGDTLVVSEISRLGRSLTEVMTILHTLMETGCRVYTCKERFELDDSINSKVLAFAFSLAAEIERQMISSRTREALSRLKSEGRTLGRPKGSLSVSKLDGRDVEIRDMLAKGVSKASAARMLGVSRGTLYGWLESRTIKGAQA